MKNSLSHIAGILSVLVLLAASLVSCDKRNQPPVASLQVFPPFGDTSILFVFSAGESEDDRNYPIGLMYRWDTDGDGRWDTGYATNSTIAKRFTRPGTYLAAVEVIDLDGASTLAKDSVTVFGGNQAIDTLTDSRDGNRYRIVKIQDRWWMAENLRFGIEIPTSREPSDNDTVERYRLHQTRSKDTVGGVYGWLEAMNYRVNDPKGICPDGWHIPTRQEWQLLFAAYPGLYSLHYYGKNGLSNLNLDLNNEATRERDFFIENGDFWGGFWGSTYKTEVTRYFAFIVGFNSGSKELSYCCWDQTQIIDNGDEIGYRSVRCIRDK
jgi:uncharacterized protein (TIGR02145 family)